MALSTATAMAFAIAPALAQGSFIGLAVVKDIIETYSGTLSLEDSPLGGTAFRLWLPSDARPPGTRRRRG